MKIYEYTLEKDRRICYHLNDVNEIPIIKKYGDYI